MRRRSAWKDTPAGRSTTAATCSAAGRDVAGQLGYGVRSDVSHPKVSLDLEDGEPSLDINAAALARGRLQHDLAEVVVSKLQRSGR